MEWNITSGGSLCISSNGVSNSILWALGFNGEVFAFNAEDVSTGPLWSSQMNSSNFFFKYQI